MSTIYVVTSGRYSDYGIDAVFSTKELAEAYVEQARQTSSRSDAGVEEWELDECASERAMPVWGTSIRLETGEIEERLPCGWHSPMLWPQGRRGLIEGPKAFDKAWAWVDAVSSVSQDHANKLAAEARQQWLRDEAYRTDNRLDAEVLA